MISPFRKLYLHKAGLQATFAAIEVLLVPRPLFCAVAFQTQVLNPEEDDFLVKSVRTLLEDFLLDLDISCVGGKIEIGLRVPQGSHPKRSPAPDTSVSRTETS